MALAPTARLLAAFGAGIAVATVFHRASTTDDLLRPPRRRRLQQRVQCGWDARQGWRTAIVWAGWPGANISLSRRHEAQTIDQRQQQLLLRQLPVLGRENPDFGNPDVHGWLGSQFGQDLLVAELLGHRRGGYFVDLAANDAAIASNTLNFELAYGFAGLCIEAYAPRAATPVLCDTPERHC